MRLKYIFMCAVPLLFSGSGPQASTPPTSYHHLALPASLFCSPPFPQNILLHLLIGPTRRHVCHAHHCTLQLHAVFVYFGGTRKSSLKELVLNIKRHEKNTLSTCALISGFEWLMSRFLTSQVYVLMFRQHKKTDVVELVPKTLIDKTGSVMILLKRC